MLWGKTSKLDLTAGTPPGGVPESLEKTPLMVRGLCKKYQSGLWANRNINLTGNAGEILAVVGPNGAGKTTLIRQITTELIPTSGSISVLGFDAIKSPLKVKSMIGVVPQEATPFDYLTPYQHLRIFAKLRGIKPRESGIRARQLIEQLDLGDYQDVEIGKLSGGLKHRVLVGIAFTANPSVMVLDEPTTGLDIQSRHHIWAFLRKARDEGAFILLTTHSMEEAEALCDRVGIIREGKILALDTIVKLKAKSGHEYKITYRGYEPGAVSMVMYGDNRETLVENVRAKGISRYSVSPVNLEDVYLDLIGRPESRDDAAL